MKLLMDDCSSDRERWLKLRKIGSSSIASICHMNPYETPLELWARMTDKIPPVQETPEMRVGTLLEPEIGRNYAERTGLEVVPAKILAAHEVHEWATATPDFWIDPNDQRRILEAKTTKSRNAYMWATAAPESYVLQLTWQLGICGLEAGVLSVMIGADPQDYRDYDCEFNKPLFELCLEMAGQFWDCVQQDIPPLAGPGDAKLVAELQGPRTEEIVALSAEVEPKIESYKKWAAEAAHHEKLARQAKNERDRWAGQIMQLMGPRICGNTPSGQRVIAKWEERKGHVVQPYKFLSFKVK